MLPKEPLPLYHSWPLFDPYARFELGLADVSVAAAGPIETWRCDVATSTLTWSPGVFDLFGLPRDCVPTREASLPRYAEDSRVAMERLRAHALRHRRGFTLDARLRLPDGDRWMRLTAAPSEEEGALILAGTKQDVTVLYRPR
jgi:PAS domain-containing protein